MNRFLKLSALFFAVGVLIVAFYSCAGETSSVADSYPNTRSDQPRKLMEFVNLQSRSGASGTEDGYYEPGTLSGKGNLILYTDYATKQRIPLCNRPECLHNDDTCTAWVSRSFVPFAAGGKLYIIYNSTENPSLSVEDQYQRIEQMDLNGENRKVLVRFEANKEMTGNIVCDGTYFYVIRERVESATSASYELLRISLSDGSVETLEELDKQYFLLGGWGSQLLLKDIDFAEMVPLTELYKLDGRVNTNTLSLYDIDSKRLSVLEQWDSSEKSVLTCRDKMYALVYGDTPLLVETNLQTKEEKIVCDEFPFPVLSSSYLSEIWDGYLIIQTSESDENKSEQISREFCVNCNTGSVNELSNKYERNGKEIPYLILAQTQGFFLIQSGVEEYTITASAPDGSKFETTSSRSILALISKEDYFNNEDTVNIITSVD